MERVRDTCTMHVHRDVILPDVERVVRPAVGELYLEMDAHFDAVYPRLDRLARSSQM